MDKPIVVVSQAHVGVGGAASLDGTIVEESYSGEVCKRIAEKLSGAGVDVQPISLPLVRTAKPDAPDTKVHAINRIRPALAVEPHLNALRVPGAIDEDDDHRRLADDPRGCGSMVLFTATSERSRRAAASVAQMLDAVLPAAKDAGGKHGPFHRWGPEECPGPMVHRQRVSFLQDTSCPAVLVECLFLSNPDELEWLKGPDSAEVLADGIAGGIVAWLRHEGLLEIRPPEAAPAA